MGKFIFLKTINIKRKHKILYFFSTILFLFSFISPFLAGSYTQSIHKEELSNYIAERVKDSTRNGDLLAVSVTPTSDSGWFPCRDEDEFYALYGVFRQQTATFGGGFNLRKEHSINIPEIDNETNYSIFYSGPDTSVKYDGHYKHWYYPFELMFETERMYDISRYMIYISQSQADKMLENRGVSKDNNKYTENDYKSLLKSLTDVEIDGNVYSCVICNIYLETNYYYESFKEILNDYILIAYYCPADLPRSYIYFFRSFSYQNIYFMDHISNVYNNKKFDIRLMETNTIKKIDNDYIMSFYYSPSLNSNAVLIIALLVISLVFITIYCVVAFLLRISYKRLYIVSSFALSLFPYISFLIYSNVTKSIVFFSDFAIRWYVYMVLYFVALSIVMLFIRYLINRAGKKR